MLDVSTWLCHVQESVLLESMFPLCSYLPWRFQGHFCTVQATKLLYGIKGDSQSPNGFFATRKIGQFFFTTDNPYMPACHCTQLARSSSYDLEPDILFFIYLLLKSYTKYNKKN